MCKAPGTVLEPLDLSAHASLEPPMQLPVLSLLLQEVLGQDLPHPGSCPWDVHTG